MKASTKKQVVGWREWIHFPELGIPRIKAKIDTGARTSTLHAFKIEPYREKGIHKVNFFIHPLQRNQKKVIKCSAKIFDKRIVSDSGGHRERRYVIQTPVEMGEHRWIIELTLTNRDTMLFRMLLGRTALKKNFVVDPSTSYRMGKA